MYKTPLIRAIRMSVIGRDHFIKSAFGEKPLVYADYTASGRSLGFIERFITQRVLPFYANTHSESSFTGAQTNVLREQAREQIHRAVNASDEDLVIFCGSGATAAINKLIDILQLRLPSVLIDPDRLDNPITAPMRPVVFIGPYEHHSNELPWRESLADVVTIPLNAHGQLDLIALSNTLNEYDERDLKIGSFSAASNVTGIKTDVDAVTQLLHQHGALSFWDYAAAGPYVGINMQANNEEGDTYKDAVFLSPHKFIGGPGTPGVLIVKQQLLSRRIPTAPGGGTVMYVTPEDHRYSDDVIRREESGTAAIVESIRAGLVFKLQQQVGTDEIERRETDFVTRALARWSACDAIEILGNPTIDRLSIIALRIKYQDKDLHYSFVVALLNDLFGIQARGGCSCAGPYGHTLLDMDREYSKAIEAQLLEGHMILRPGWVRLNFNYFIDEASFEYIVHAVELIAEHGWRLLPYYKFDDTHQIWCYQNTQRLLVTHLDDMDSFINDSSAEQQLTNRGAENTAQLFEFYTQQAETELCRGSRVAEAYVLTLPPAVEALRWFVLPQEVTPLLEEQ